MSKKRCMDTVSSNNFVNEYKMDLPFPDEFDKDNQMAKDHTIAYGI